MAEYMTTREVARYLRLNEKKVYDLVARGQLPAARVSGKWLFPAHLVDEWVSRHTVHPKTGLMGAVLDDLIVVQGSDDWVFARAAEHFQGERAVSVVSTRCGSLAGLSAVSEGRAHLAGCHVANDQVTLSLGEQGAYLVTLCERSQGLIYDRRRHPWIRGAASLSGQSLRFAERQPLSGTYRLARALLDGAGVAEADLTPVGPFSTHLELALAIARGEADVGVGTRLAAEQCRLDFAELATEPFKLAVPLAYASHPRLAGFLEFVLEDLQESAAAGVAGYGFGSLGRVEPLGGRPGTGGGRAGTRIAEA